jgi:hypothetical protein
VTNATAAQGFADAVRADLEWPYLAQRFETFGFWFVQLFDFGQLSANGIHYNADQTGGVTEYTHTFANGSLRTAVSLRGQPAGRYTTWLAQGSNTPARVPVLDHFGASFIDAPASTPAITFGVDMGANCLSVTVEYSVDSTFTVGVTTLVYDRVISGNFFIDSILIATADRDKTYFVRCTPYSGPEVAGPAVSGVAGEPATNTVFVPKAFVDTVTATWDLSTPGAAKVNVGAFTGGGALLGYAYDNTQTSSVADPTTDTAIASMSVTFTLGSTTVVSIRVSIRAAKITGFMVASLYDNGSKLAPANINGTSPPPEGWYFNDMNNHERANQHVMFEYVTSLASGSHTIDVREAASGTTVAKSFGERSIIVTQLS